jgi:hypothetical protein
MPFTYSFHRGQSVYVLLRGSGAVNLVMWANAMRQILADRAFRETMPIVLDVTEAIGAPQPDEVAVIARTWRLMTPRSHGAIVAPDGIQLDIARQIEELSEDRVRAFTDVPTAVHWLLDPAAGNEVVPS